MGSVRSGRLRVLAIALAVLVPTCFGPAVARAQIDDVRDEARRLFAQGSADFVAGRFTAALESFRASHRLLPSPNSGLLIARCLLELNRPVEAHETYLAVAQDARRRAEAGDAKYARTADAATEEADQVRATLGALRVRVSPPARGSHIDIDGVVTDATGVDVVLLRQPGEVRVTLKQENGVQQSQRATVVVGAEVSVEFQPGPSAPAAPGVERKAEPPSTQPTRYGWALPAAAIAGGVGVAGAAAFIGFGLASESTYHDLASRCGPLSCGPQDRAEADRGKRDQTIANVALGVGIVGTASAVAFLLVHASDSSAATSPRISIGPGSVAGRF
jgi:hypothetical protein